MYAPLTEADYIGEVTCNTCEWWNDEMCCQAPSVYVGTYTKYDHTCDCWEAIRFDQ